MSRSSRKPKILVAAMIVLASACGVGRQPAPADGRYGEVSGDVAGVQLSVAYAGVGDLNERGRSGQIVVLSDLPGFCDEMLNDPPDVVMLRMTFYHTATGPYTVVEHAGLQPFGTLVVEALLVSRQDGQERLKQHAVSGQVTLEEITPATSEPLATDSVARGTFRLEFLRDAPRTVVCTSTCDESGTCLLGCDCENPDGSAFQCTSESVASSCCTEGLAEAQALTGRFDASYCQYLVTGFL